MMNIPTPENKWIHIHIHPYLPDRDHSSANVLVWVVCCLVICYSLQLAVCLHLVTPPWWDELGITAVKAESFLTVDR